jgi:taurine dioxygenase
MAPLLSDSDAVGQAIHPITIKHPDSGKEVLYVNPRLTIGFAGQTYDASKPLLDELYAHVDQPEHTCRFDWQPGSVAFWDNQLTWHFAQNDYHGEKRLMHRITLAGKALASA